MSITFHPAIDDTDPEPIYKLMCGDTELSRVVGYSPAYLDASAHGLLCTEFLCAGYGASVEAIHPAGQEPVNMANRNANDVLIVLGIEEDCGTLDAALMLDRIDTALAIGFADAAMPTLALGQRVECGRDPGYIADRLAQIRTLALACHEAGKAITWG